MTTVTLSPKFQVVIPKPVRESFKLKSGMKIEVIPLNKQIILVPLRPLKELKGAFKGMDTTIEREADREL